MKLIILYPVNLIGKRSALADDSDDDGEPNTYDYNDSFIDDHHQDSGGGI